MPQGAPARKEKKKPKKDAASKSKVAPSALGSAPLATAVEIVGKKRKQRDEE